MLLFVFLSLGVGLLFGCSGSERAAQSATAKTGTSSPTMSDEIALQHFIEGSTLDQKGEYATAILEYQDALTRKQDPAVYHAMAKDYSLLGKNELAMKMGREAVRLNPDNRTFHETLGEIYLNAFELDGAIKEYEQVIRIDSSYFDGWINLSRLWQVKSPTKALEVYQQLLNRFGPNADTYFQMAQIYNSLNKLDKAVAALKGLLSVDPANFEVKKVLGDTYLRLDSVNAALKIYDELAELRPENLEVRAATAHAYLSKQDYDHAAQQFDAILRKDTLSADDQLKFGQVFVSFIREDSAVVPYALKLFKKISATHPNDWRPYWFLGAIDNVMRDDSSALLNFGKVKDLASWNADGWVGVASVYYDRNRFQEAIDMLTKAKKTVPDEFRIYFLLGISYQRNHQPVDAASSLERALQLDQKNVGCMSALGLVYDELHRHEDSDSMYEHAIRLDPKNHLLLNNYGYSLGERGIQLDRALAMAKEAVRQQPLNQSYLDTFGWIYFMKGDYEEAERYIRKAIELGSTSPVIHEHLGDIYFKMQQKEKAMEYWRKALQFDGSNTALQEKIQRGSL
jgi:tetratricopeptide (TPR) repeat protein